MLVRAGVGHLRLVDMDQVSLSSLNRSAVAFRSDVGLPKAEVLRLEVVADDPLSRSLLTSSLHRARHAVIESLRRALAPHGGGGARLRMRGSVTEYTR